MAFSTILAALLLAAADPAEPQTAAPQRLQFESVRWRVAPPFADPSFATWQGTPYEKNWPNYAIALGEVVFIDTAIWAYDNYVAKAPYADISLDSIKQNFNKGWIVDTDDFWANSLMHPMHGNLNFNAARGVGMNFYESFGFAFIGSAIWEQFAEIQPPSMNDQINTPFGGSVLGEVLFRMSRLILDSGGYNPGPWREFSAFLINPSGGLNRLIFKEKYRGPMLLPPSWIGEFRFGAVVAGSSKAAEVAERHTQVGPWGSLGAHIVYGVPGTPDLSFSRPFSHFEASASLSFTADLTVHATSTLLLRGLLYGEPLGPNGENGLWGLFTSYDFIAPATFRAQGFGIGPGISFARRWDWFELHATGVLELLPWSGGGTTVPLGVRDYHYGAGGEAVLQLRMHFGDRVVLRLEGREFLISGSYSTGASEQISYGKIGATGRIYGMHGLSLELDTAHRQAVYPDKPDIWQRAAVFSVFYTLLTGW